MRTAKAGDDQVRLTLAMRPGPSFRIEALDGLVHWTVVYCAAAESGTVEWTDPATGDHGRPFYRAVQE